MVDKLAEIEKLMECEEDSAKKILAFTLDEDEEVRLRAVEALQNFPPNELMINRIRECLHDSDELVRVASAELIGYWKDSDSLDRLYSLLEDESALVRSSAMISIAQIGYRKSSEILRTHLSDVTGAEKASLNMALYILGERDYLAELLQQLNDEDYLTRCAVANLLANFVKKEDVKKVTSELKSALVSEKQKSVLSAIQTAVSVLKG